MTRILFFGRLSDVAGCGEKRVDLPREVRTVGDLRAWLARSDDVLAAHIRLASVRAAVDRVMCDDLASILGAEEIAFMSPLSGG